MRNILKIIILILLFILCVNLACAEDQIFFHVHETGKITSYYDEYYIYQVEGNITIRNPSNVSIYAFNIPLYLSTLEIRNVNSSMNYFRNNNLWCEGVEAHGSVTVPYKIVGISTENLARSNKSVLYSAITFFDSKIYSSLMGTLKKGPMEDPAVTGRDGRLITVRFDNPTTFVYNINKVKVIKTSGIDLTDELRQWNFPSDERDINLRDRTILKPYESWVIDFIDDEAVEGQVYWLSSDIFLEGLVFTHNHSLRFFDQDDLYIPLNDTNATEDLSNATERIKNRLFIRKFSSKQLINPYETVNITLVINSIEPQSLDVTVKDRIPAGFQIKNMLSSARIVKEGTDEYILIEEKLDMGGTKRLNYELELIDKDSVGVDYFPSAELIYKNVSVFSQRVQFIRQYVPEKKLYLQKKLRHVSDDNVEVTLMLQNLGDSKVESLVLKEFLRAENEFREISLAPESKGVWKIEKLEQGEIWTVRYVTGKETNLNSLPEVFGVPRESILMTIILNNVVRSGFFISASKVIEYVGLTIVVLAGLLVVLLQFKDMHAKKKERQSKVKNSAEFFEDNAKSKAFETGSMIKEIKEKTDVHQKSSDNQIDNTNYQNPENHEKKTQGLKFSDIETQAESKHKTDYSELDDNQKSLEKLKEEF